MEVITVLVLIILGNVGARNIPVHMDESLELPLVVDDLPSYTKTPHTAIFPTGDLGGSVVDVQDLGQHLNKNDENEDVGDHIHNVEANENSLDSDIYETASYENKNDKEEEIDSVLKPVEVAVVEKRRVKAEYIVLESRFALTAPECPSGKVRVGNECWVKQ